MTVTFNNSTNDLEKKLREKAELKKSGGRDGELTPWEKFQQKRKEKRKERKKKKGKGEPADDDNLYEGDTAFGNAGTLSSSEEEDEDKRPATNEQLNRLIGDENDFDEKHNFDMRGIVRASKIASKNLKGQRKKKEDRKAKNVVGLDNDFAVNTGDDRFSALMDGDSRFGIDKTDVNYKDTPAMKEIMKEQTKRRNKKRKKEVVVDDVSAKDASGSASAMALGALVSSLKKKVKQ